MIVKYILQLFNISLNRSLSHKLFAFVVELLVLVFSASFDSSPKVTTGTTWRRSIKDIFNGHTTPTAL